MAVITKVGAVTFTHNDNYTGEIEIRRGAASVKVSADAFKKLAAEFVRHDAMRKIESMPAADLLTMFRN